MNVDIENITSKKQPFLRSIYEVIYYSYFEVVKLFPTKKLNNAEIIQIHLRLYHMKSKQI